MRWRLPFPVRRCLHYLPTTASSGAHRRQQICRTSSTLLQIMQEHIPEISSQTTTSKLTAEHDDISKRRHRMEATVSSRIRQRTDLEVADACRSLLYAKRYQAAERLFEQHLSTTAHTGEVDVDLCNVFVEHFLQQNVNQRRAEDIYRHHLGKKANLDTHLQFMRYGLQQHDYALVKKHLALAMELGVPSVVIVGLPMWSMEERLLLRPLSAIGAPKHPPTSPAALLFDWDSVFNADDPIPVDDLSDPNLKEKEGETARPSFDIHIARSKSELGGVDLMADLATLFVNVGDKCPEDLLHTQRRLEDATYEASQQLQHRRQLAQTRITGLPTMEGMHRLMADWSSLLTDWIQDEMTRRLERGLNNTVDDAGDEQVDEQQWGWSQSDADYFCALLAPLPADKIALITVTELLSIRSFDPELGGVKLVTLAKNVGLRVREEMVATVAVSRPFLQRLPIHPQLVKQLLMGWEGRRRIENAVHVAMASCQERIIEESQEAWIPAWTSTQAVQLGTWLVWAALRAYGNHTTTNSTNNNGNNHQQPPYYHTVVFDYRTNHRQGVIRPSQQVLKALLSASNMTATSPGLCHLVVNDPWALPMLIPPRPWLTLQSGGYVKRRTPFVRLKDDPMHAEVLRNADAEGLLETVKRGLDVLGQTPWAINRDILQLQVDMWNDKIDPRSMTAFPSHAPQPPERPRAECKMSDMTPPQRAAYISAMQQWQRDRAAHVELISAQCDANYKLEIAKMFANARAFYMPHSVDFRGRAYTIPPHLSHISSDAARGLLLFAEAKPLGERGLFWLKVHVANLYGFDKASMAERAAWTDNKMEQIVKSARSPKVDQFWRQADEPWQFLAACIELTRAREYEGGPTQYPCRLPIQQDGSCNGLQHYAALGRDPEGAAKVNLAPSDRPQDVYRSVADLVEKRLQQDALATSQVSNEERAVAKRLLGKVNRKIVKTTVMTNVYGVTEYGAREQLCLRMKEAGLFTESQDHQMMLVARAYLAKLVFASLKELFVRAKAIQDWLTQAAQEIVHAVPKDAAVLLGMNRATNYVDDDHHLLPPLLSYRRPVMERPDWRKMSLRDRHLARYPQTMVSWTTPLHFPVIQPYSRSRHVRLHTALQTVTVRSPTLSDPVDPVKQAAAFPPNFVHSLDASHMFMTALACHQQGITFASVHDCFWTHAATVDQMSHIIRQQFVKLYEEDVLRRLREEFLVRYDGYVVPVRTEAGKAVWRPIHFPPVPSRGSFDLNLVLQSEYFFS